ncbi:MAG: hypothetical protein ACXQS2_03490 [Methermicoccaceae archaeon]
MGTNNIWDYIGREVVLAGEYGGGDNDMKGEGQAGGMGLGVGGNCVCPKCGYTVLHQRGVPCYKMECPQCGTMMTREG